MTCSEQQDARELVPAITRELTRIAPDTTTWVPSIGVRAHTARMLQPPVSLSFPPSLYLVFQGQKRILAGDDEIEYGAGVMVSFAMRTPTLMEVTRASRAEPYRSLEMPFEHGVVAALGADLGLRARPVDRIVAVDPLPQPVLEPVLRLLRLAREPRDAAALAASVRREIWYRVLTSTGDGPAMFLELVRTESVLGRVGTAVEWMHQHVHQPVDIRLVAGIARMSPTSLHRHFKIATGASPGVYHNRLRLREARRLILQGSSTVQQAAAVVGYASPSQFTRDYRREFGLPPSHDHRPVDEAPQPMLANPEHIAVDPDSPDRPVMS